MCAVQVLMEVEGSKCYLRVKKVAMKGWMNEDKE